MLVSHEELLKDLKTNRSIQIKVFNLGENLGMDFAYFGHYIALKKYFPNVEIDLFRSNVDETNCIGLETYEEKANLPVRKLVMEIVKQRYGGHSGPDWCSKLNNKEYGIFSDGFRSVDGYDYVWGIGYGGAPCWMEQYPEDTKFIGASTVKVALEQYLQEKKLFPELTQISLGVNHHRIKPWERTALDYLVMDDPVYPFTFKPSFTDKFTDNLKDYLRVGLRWPDHVRWYYSIDRQFEVLINIIQEIKAAGKEAKLIFTLKDGEVGNNFNRGQTVDKLLNIQSLADDCIFTYSWTANPYHARKTEAEELAILSKSGIKKVHKLDIWEDLYVSSQAKVYLSDPGGFAEVISMLRKQSDTTFLFPVSFGHSCTYINLDQTGEPVRLKVNPLTVNQCYACEAVLSRPDDPEGYRTTHWNLQYLNDKRKVGDNCKGDDWKYFEAAQNTVFKDWYEATKEDLIGAVVKEYLK